MADFGGRSYLHSAIRKHGADSFQAEAICECSSKEDMDILEGFCISAFNTKVPYGYNLTDGGDGVVGYKHTPESQAKMSLAQKGNTKRQGQKCPETSERMRGNKYSVGLKRTEAEKEHLRQVFKGNKNGLGYKHTPEARIKMTLARTGKPLSTGHIESIRRSHIKAVCKRGHDITSPDSVYIRNGVRKGCKLCIRAASEQQRKRNKENALRDARQQNGGLLHVEGSPIYGNGNQVPAGR